MKLRKGFCIMIGILILICLVACGNVPEEKTPFDTPSIETNDSPESLPPTKDLNWVIFSKRTAKKSQLDAILSLDDDFGGYWTPSEEEILMVEDGLPEFLSQYPTLFSRQPPAQEWLDEYQRQYVGFEHKGVRFIFGAFFCDNFGEDWDQELFVPIDGGDCFFQIRYDVESMEFVGLIVNGES